MRAIGNGAEERSITMNAFKAACVKLATAWDYNAKCVKRRKGDGKKIRRYARRKLRRESSEE